MTRDTIDYNGTFLEASDGSRSIDLDGSPGFGGIAQTFSTIPGQDYLVTFDLAGNPNGPPTIKQMRVEAAGQSADFSFDTTGRSFSDLGWQAQSWQFTAVDTSTTIEFFSLNTVNGFRGPTLDNVSVVPNADGPPDITVNIAPGATPSEAGPTNGTYIISLSDPVSNEGLILDYRVTGSATRDADYSLSAGAGVTNITGNQITLAEGSTTATVNLIPITDAITDPEETVRLAITASPRYQVGSNNSATLSITDSEGGIEPPPPSDDINLDIDGNGETDALTDGILAIRYLFGFSGDILIDNVIGEGATRTTALEITNYLDLARSTMLDVDNNGMADALTDGLMIVRYLFGFGGNAAIDGAIGPNATRTTADAIIAHLESFDL